MGVLFLFIKVGGRDLRLELKEGTHLLIGRSKDCDIVLEPRSVSGKHLEIHWDGRKVFLEDLKSSHGCFVLPDKVPLQKKAFSPAPTQLSILVADVPFHMSWSLKGFEDQTAFTGVDFGSEHFEKTQLQDAHQQQPKQEQRPSLSDAKKSIAKRTDEPIAPVAVQAAQNSQFFGFLVSVAISLLMLRFWWTSPMKIILEAGDLVLRNGGALDFYIQFIQTLQKNLFIFLLLSLVLFFILYKNPFAKIESYFGSWKHRFSQKWVRPISIILFFVAVFSPLFVSTRFNVPVGKYSEIQKMMTLDSKNLGAESTSRKLFELSRPLQGSSYLYLRLLNVRFHRIFEECASDKNQAWEQKRMCLVLFLAASIETFDEVRPALLTEVALRLNLLLALDGVIRVVRVEDLNSQSISFFTNALDSIGLTREKQKINDLIYSKDATKEKVLSDLIVMRRKLDQRIVSRQKELGYPSDLQLKPFNPLNLGL